MVHFVLELTHRYHLPEIESLPKPGWVPLQDLIHTGSIGAEVIGGIPDLGQRLRPETILNQPITSLMTQHAQIRLELLTRNLTTTGELLSLSPDEFYAIPLQKDLQKRVSDYVEGLALTPQAKLLQWMFGQVQRPVPLEYEGELVRGVNAEIATFPEPTGFGAIRNRGLVVVLGFGLYDGITRSDKEVEAMLSISVGGVQSAKNDVLNSSERFKKRQVLRGYLTLPEDMDSLKQFGVVFRNQLPASPFSEDVVPEPEQPVTNNLLPAADIPANIARLSIDELELSTRSHNALKRSSIHTIGELLTYTEDELLGEGTRAFGVASLNEVKGKLRALLNQDLSTFPPSFEANELSQQSKEYNEFLEQQRQILDNAEMEKAREVIDAAVSSGATTADEIQRWMIERQISIIKNVHPQKWFVKATIEYLLNNPTKEK